MKQGIRMSGIVVEQFRMLISFGPRSFASCWKKSCPRLMADHARSCETSGDWGFLLTSLTSLWNFSRLIFWRWIRLNQAESGWISEAILAAIFPLWTDTSMTFMAVLHSGQLAVLWYRCLSEQSGSCSQVFLLQVSSIEVMGKRSGSHKHMSVCLALHISERVRWIEKTALPSLHHKHFVASLEEFFIEWESHRWAAI